MAGRPMKAGLDYFDLDCHTEEKVRLIQAEFGLKGFAVVVKLYQKIYGEFGYYCEWNEDSLFLFMSENGVPSDSKNLISAIVSACIRRDIFSERLFKEYGILTSAGVQKRYLNATSRREAVSMKKEYLLLSVDKITNNVVINSINVDRNSMNVDRNSQSRVEKSRVEKSRVEKSRVEKVITVSKDTVCPTQDVRRTVDAWNELQAYGIKPISKISSGSQRYQRLVARIKQHGIDNVLLAIDRIKESDFLQGKNNRGWVITFDWFILPNNFPKVLDENYSNGNHRQAYQSQTERMLENHYSMVDDWVRKKEEEGREHDN